ncbi:LysR family transcriptional regulator [Herbaspirillum sp. RTI4]|uniref:LysR family transcriptional regulator n=1 Tax=Herbaspirillum sp. RTI4 TaxID=3048640 RepID=UPI002AB3B2BC|nr:LysR family transcriptional regulator [Herbaspirillum sp. RTI4]MDY7577996.1 LysR family transcriptional regulator [Herbaspirillum sp. RTI4]MEA9982074.1 LysR family transcriptional regulator [Herbaspirillum sp. RTI4]
MTLEQLRIFVEVAERGHLTQAASALALTPSAVSSSIRVLESRYSTPLFNRVGRRIEISEAGRIFLTEARATLASARTAELVLSELSGLRSGSLSIQASQTIASYWLPSLLVDFHQRYPQIALSLTIGNTQQVAQAVTDGAADLGFIEGEIDEPELITETVGQDHIVAVVAPGHPWANGKPRTAADLLSGQWIMREQGSGTRSAFEELLKDIGVDASGLQIALTLPSNEAVRTAVMSGPFATVVSELVVASHLQVGLLCRINIDLPPRSFYLLRHKARYKTKASLALQEMIQQQHAALLVQ